MAKIDFNYAKTEHVVWLVRLNRFLNGKRAIQNKELVSHDNCRLGKWLKSEDRTKYGDLPEMSELIEKHIELHVLVKIIVRMKESGNDTVARREFKQLEKISNRIVSLINILKQKIKQ